MLESQSFNFHIDSAAFVSTLPMMLKGLIGIFAVIVVIYLFIVLLNKLTSRRKPNK